MPQPAQCPGTSKQDYCTPPDFLEAVRVMKGIDDFDWDLAATAENSVVPHNHYYSLADNALTMPWKVNYGWNWLNPPFKNIAPWVEYAYKQSLMVHRTHQEGAQTLVLLPAGVSTEWFADWVDRKCCVRFIRPRLTFGGTLPNPKTGKVDPYPKDLILLEYGPTVRARYECWQWK